eukprot:UC1_evm1s651
MIRPLSYILANLALQVPMMFVLAACGLSVSGYGIANWYGPSYPLALCVFALILWCYECIAQMCSIVSSDPLMGMLTFVQFWFVGFLFSGVMVAEDAVIWPFRLFTIILPLKWGLRSFAYLEFDPTTFEGATLCPTEGNASCLYHTYENGSTRLPGWGCAWNPVTRPCMGQQGWQVLDTLKITFSSITSENHVFVDCMIILGIAAAFKLLYVFMFIYKVNRASKLRPALKYAKGKKGMGGKDYGTTTKKATTAFGFETNPSSVAPAPMSGANESSLVRTPSKTVRTSWD